MTAAEVDDDNGHNNVQWMNEEFEALFGNNDDSELEF